MGILVDKLKKHFGFGGDVVKELIDLGGGDEGASGESLRGSIEWQWREMHGGKPPAKQNPATTDRSLALTEILGTSVFKAKLKNTKLPSCGKNTVRQTARLSLFLVGNPRRDLEPTPPRS